MYGRCIQSAYDTILKGYVHSAYRIDFQRIAQKMGIETQADADACAIRFLNAYRLKRDFQTIISDASPVIVGADYVLEHPTEVLVALKHRISDVDWKTLWKWANSRRCVMPVEVWSVPKSLIVLEKRLKRPCAKKIAKDFNAND